VLSEVEVVELLTLVGYYATLALQLRILRIARPGVDAASVDS